jgi:hypothetical protein
MSRWQKALWNRRVEAVLLGVIVLATTLCLPGPSALAGAEGAFPDPSRVSLLPASVPGSTRVLSFLPAAGPVFRGEGTRIPGGGPPGSELARIPASRSGRTEIPLAEILLPEKATALGRLHVDAHAPPPTE